MPVVMRIVGHPRIPTEFDGQFLVEYDPERNGRTPQGARLLAHIVCSPDLSQAQQWPNAKAALRCYRQVCKRDPHGQRFSGQGLNRPLTAFTVEILTLAQAGLGQAANGR